MTPDVELTDEIAEFLENLRDSNEVNMMGAGPYIQEEFGCTPAEAREVLLLWIKGYS